MPTTVKELLNAANAVVPRITPAEAQAMIAKGNTLVVDVRDAAEVAESGKVAGAVHVSRGLLEFRADPDYPSHDKAFARGETVILYCGSGGRAALAGKLLKDMGYERVYNLGGFKDWVAAGGAVEAGRRGSWPTSSASSRARRVAAAMKPERVIDRRSAARSIFATKLSSRLMLRRKARDGRSPRTSKRATSRASGSPLI